jgi:predicted nucleotide-binding protein (sugar kinase/HSP70/actin superfamily)
MINFLTQCDILDYQPIYSYIISENTEIDKNIRVRMIKLILYFRKLLIKQLTMGHHNIQNKSIKKIIETLSRLFT